MWAAHLAGRLNSRSISKSTSDHLVIFKKLKTSKQNLESFNVLLQENQCNCMWKFKDSLKIAFKLDMAAKSQMILPAVGYNASKKHHLFVILCRHEIKNGEKTELWRYSNMCQKRKQKWKNTKNPKHQQ